jgi:hypothetical protein
MRLPADGSRGATRTLEPELASSRSYALGTYTPDSVPRVPFKSSAAHPTGHDQDRPRPDSATGMVSTGASAYGSVQPDNR